MVKKVLVFCISLISVLSAQDITFKQFTELVAGDLKKNIYLDQDIKDYKLDLIIPHRYRKGELYEMYKNVLFAHDLKLAYNKIGKFYYVKKIPPSELPEPEEPAYSKLHYYSYKIRNVTNEDVLSVMRIFPNVRMSYLKQSDIIAYSATRSQHIEIRKLLEIADNKVASKMIKLTIFTLNKDKAKSYGSKIDKFQFSFGLDIKSALSSILSNSYNRVTNLADTASMFFTLYALEDAGIANIEQSPVLLVSNGKETSVNSVLNVPYLESTITTQENISTTREQIKYRDIGLVVNVKPKVKKNSVYLDLNLVSEELLSSNDDKPLTQKISYRNFVTVKKGKPILLTGISKKVRSKSTTGIPILKDIPIIGLLFRSTTKKESNLSINILIELVDRKTKTYSKQHFKRYLSKLPKNFVRSSSPVKRTSAHPDPMKILNGRF